MTKAVRTFVALCLCVSLTAAFAQKKPLDHSVYDSWRSAVGATLSRNGKYLVYGSRPAVGDADLILVDLTTNRSTTYPRGTSQRFTHDGKFLVFTVVPAEADVEKAKKEKKKPEEMPKNSLTILNLETGESKVIGRVQSFSIAEEGSEWIALRLEPEPAAKPPTPPTPEKPDPEAKPEPEQKPKKRTGHAVGKDLLLIELATGREIKLSDVSDFGWQKEGVALVYAVSTKDGTGDGLFRLLPSVGEATALAEGMATYMSISIHETGSVTYLSDSRTYTEKAPSWDIYLWRSGAPTKMVVQADSEAFPKDWETTDRGGVRFSESGKRLLFATKLKEQEPEKKDETPAEEKVVVDVWNWQDSLIQPMQLRRAASVKNKTYAAMFDTGSNKVLQLETEEIPSVNIADRGDGDIAIGSNSDLYGPLVSYDRTYSDYYLIDLKSNKRTRLKEQSDESVQLSPEGRWMAWFDSEIGAWFTRRTTADAQTVEASKGIPHPLFNELHDSPSLPNSYGLVGWRDENTLLVNDSYDIWLLSADGKKAPICLTKGWGRERSMRLRAMRVDREERYWKPSEPMLLNASNLRTRASGFFNLLPNGTIEQLIYGDYDFSFSSKADDADVVLMTRERFNEYPDLWTTNMRFQNAVKHSDINPQMRDYLWGTAELVEWMSNDGVELQGVVYKPENFDPGKKYPTMVYFYERLSQQLHNFFSPGPGSSSISIPFYVSRGYVVFTPDIPYEVGYPGESAESAIVPGVLSLIEKGITDPKRIGMQGHSWGGYQVAHLITRTNLFAAAEAGAPVSNMFSAYGGIRWGTGMSRQFQYEKTQSRIGGTMWEKPLQFIENSPVFWADRVKTPLLMLHNDQDGAVPWYQGIEMYMALRRLNKPVWLFNYNGEDHGIGKRQNRKDWAIRMQQFFDHYLIDGPAPKWLTEGVPAVKKGEDLGLATGGG